MVSGCFPGAANSVQLMHIPVPAHCDQNIEEVIILISEFLKSFVIPLVRLLPICGSKIENTPNIQFDTLCNMHVMPLVKSTNAISKLR